MKNKKKKSKHISKEAKKKNKFKQKKNYNESIKEVYDLFGLDLSKPFKNMIILQKMK